MPTTFHPGDQQQHRYVVVPADFATFTEGLVHPVLSTFALARECEWAGRLFVLAMRAEGQEGIGTEISLRHHAPAFEGEELLITATFEALDARGELRCAIEARVGERLVASGHTGQRLVDRARLAARFAALRAENSPGA